MAKRIRGVQSNGKEKIATHIVIPSEKKTKNDTINGYIELTGIKKPICSQNLRSLNVQTGQNKGRPVAATCSVDNMVAAHVTISGKPGIFIVPMCNKHNDSGFGYPSTGDGVFLKKCKAVKVEHSLKSARLSPKRSSAKKNPIKKSNTSKKKKSYNTKFKNLSKDQTLRRARRNDQQTWSWNGTRMGKVTDYIISSRSKRVRKKN